MTCSCTSKLLHTTLGSRINGVEGPNNGGGGIETLGKKTLGGWKIHRKKNKGPESNCLVIATFVSMNRDTPLLVKYSVFFKKLTAAYFTKV